MPAHDGEPQEVVPPPPPPNKNWTEQCSQEPGTSWKRLALHLESLSHSSVLLPPTA